MSTVFGALNATDESQRRVPQPGWSLIPDTYRHMSRDLRSGAWDPIEEDRQRSEFAYPADSTPSAIELMSREA